MLLLLTRPALPRIISPHISPRLIPPISHCTKAFFSKKPRKDMADRPNFPFLITPAQLASVRKSPTPSGRIIPLAAPWFLPNDPQKRTGRQVYEESRIPGARFIDVDGVKDLDSPYPHMLPSAEGFAKAMGELGIKKDDVIVVYDSKELGIFSAPRVAWMLKVFGHDRTHILDNYKIWVEKNYPVELGKPDENWEKTEYPVPAQLGVKSRVMDFEEVKKLATEGTIGKGVQLLDARSQGRWEGTEDEPRKGLSSGHIPGSISFPMTDVLDPTTRTFLPKKQLEKLFEDRNVDREGQIITSCGTGVTAAVIWTALQQVKDANVNDQDMKIYDGSWTEWAQRVKPEENLIIKNA